MLFIVHCLDETDALLPVRFCGLPAMLEVATEPEEQFGSAFLP